MAIRRVAPQLLDTGGDAAKRALFLPDMPQNLAQFDEPQPDAMQPPIDLPPWLAGGAPTIPATSSAISPQDISPETFLTPGDAIQRFTAGAPGSHQPTDPIQDPTLPPGSTPPTFPPPVPDATSHAGNNFPNPGDEWSAGSPYAMPGWDQTKWADPTFHDAKYDAGHAFSALGGANAQTIPMVMDYLKNLGYQVDYSGGDTGTVDGVFLDFSRDFGPGGANAPQWEPASPAGGTNTTTPPPSGHTTPPPAPNAPVNRPTSGDLDSLMQRFSSMFGPAPSRPAFPTGFGGPGEDIRPGLNQVGQDPLSELMTSGLAGLLQEGGTPFGQSVSATLADLISRGGVQPGTEINLNRARDAEAQAFKGMMADARGELASRGTASTPGVEQGPENLAIRRVSEQLAPTYADAVAGIESHAIDVANQSVMDALSMATGMAKDQTAAVLGAVGTGTQRQQVLSNIALDVLKENHSWNQFLAEFGLKHDQVMEELQQGRMSALVPLLQMYLQLASQSAQGFIGNG